MASLSFRICYAQCFYSMEQKNENRYSCSSLSVDMSVKDIAARFVDKVLKLDFSKKSDSDLRSEVDLPAQGQGVGLSILVSCFSDREAFNAYCFQEGHDRIKTEINKLIRLKQLNFKIYFLSWGGKLMHVGLDLGPLII